MQILCLLILNCPILLASFFFSFYILETLFCQIYHIILIQSNRWKLLHPRYITIDVCSLRCQGVRLLPSILIFIHKHDGLVCGLLCGVAAPSMTGDVVSIQKYVIYLHKVLSV
jgi:hypothetical protein